MQNNNFSTNREDLYSELFNVYRQFLPFAENAEFKLSHTFEKLEKTVNKIDINGAEYIFKSTPVLSSDKLVLRRLELRQIKLCLYKALKRHFKRRLPWGALTGVRPTKLAYEMLRNGETIENIDERLQKDYFVSKEKAGLIKRIIINQKDVNIKSDSKVNFYVHIPFCPSRCYYCSFVSVPVDKQKNLVNDYAERLVSDIEKSVRILKAAGKEVYSVYIGGGTPTVLDDIQFERILKAIPYRNIEYTCEAGRPDTITQNKAELMKKYGIGRVSVNPQTLNQKTLDIIGRKHTVEQFCAAYELMKKHGFIINVDLIAGLFGETLSDFKYTLNTIITDFKPDNITVHTLSVKNGSALKESQISVQEENKYASKMLEYAHTALSAAGYKPYYLYRQKNMLSNLENIGYALDNKICVNNVTVMEESLSVMACGAGAINKRIFNNGERIERHAVTKDIKDYVNSFESRFTKKEYFWQNGQ